MKLFSPQLQAFFHVAQVGTVHGAAEVLKLTQTAVTQRIKVLEEELSTSLFLRSRRGMQLTEAGQSLMKYCQQVRELEGEALAKFDIGKESQNIRVTVQGPSSILRSRIIGQMKKVMHEFPGMSVEFRLEDSQSNIEALKSGLSDFVILQRGLVEREFDSKLLKPEKYVLVVPSAWAKRKIEDIVKSEKIIDFDRNDQMTFNWLQKFDLFSHARLDRHFANNTDALASLIIAGLGYSALSQEFVEPYIQQGIMCSVSDKKFLDYEIALAWYPRAHPPTHFKEIIKSIK